MNLREAFESIPQQRSGGKCYVCVALQQMPEEDAETLLELLASSVTSITIARACERAGYDRLSVRSISRHRKGNCRPLSY